MRHTNLQIERAGFAQKEMFIYPGETEQVSFWTKKWGITSAQLNEAILETGSVRVNEIKSYLIAKGFVFSFSTLLLYLKHIRTKTQ